MANLVFRIKLKEVPVKIIDETNAEKIYKLKELTGEGRAKYNDSFNYTVEMENGEAKAKPADDFKVMSAVEFLSLCFYDDKDVLVSKSIIGNYPSTMTDQLYERALKLSGMDKDSVDIAKNELKEKPDSGTE